MPWGFAAVAAGGIISSAIGSSAASDAANAQIAGANASAAVQQNIFDTTRKDLAPFIGAGQNSLPIIMQLLGITPGTPGTPGHKATDIDQATGLPYGTDQAATPGTQPSFDPNSTLLKPQAGYTPSQGPFSFGSFNSGMGPLNLGAYATPAAYAGPGTYTSGGPFSFDPSQLASTPGYQFQLGQGLQAVQNQAAKGGGALGGDSLRAMQDYAQGLAGNTFNTAFGQQLSAYNTNATTSLQDFLANASTGLDTYKTNASTSLAGYNANIDSLLKGYTTNFGDTLSSWTANQGNAAQSYGINANQDLSTYSTNAATTQQNKSNIYNMIMSLVSGGQSAAAGQGQIGATTGANIGNAYTGAANASAAGTVGSANAISGGINNMSQMLMLMKMFPNGFGGTP